MKKEQGKGLSFKSETVRVMSNEELTQIAGGVPTSCFTIIIPILGITTLAFKQCR